MFKFCLMIVFLTCCQNSFDTTCKRTYSSRWQKQDYCSVEYAGGNFADMLIGYVELIKKGQ